MLLTRRGIAAATRPISSVALIALAFALVVIAPIEAHHDGDLAVDFHNAYWPAAQHMLEGASPYVDPDDPSVSGAAAFVYPAPAALAFTPFGLMPQGGATIAFTFALIVAALGGLLLMGVRDWRVFAVTATTAPYFGGWQAGNVSFILVLALAGLYRSRDAPVAAGVLVAGAVCLKLFLWPLGIWLLATRRWRAFGWALGFGLTANAVSWAIIGFGEIPRYFDLVQAISEAGERRALTVMAVLLHAGASRGLAIAAMSIIAGAVLVAAVLRARRGDDLGSFTLTIAAALLAAPLTWLHALSLLWVPMALRSPEMSPLWAVPLLLWLHGAFPEPYAEPVIALGVLALIVVVVVRKPDVTRHADDATIRSHVLAK